MIITTSLRCLRNVAARRLAASIVYNHQRSLYTEKSQNVPLLFGMFKDSNDHVHVRKLLDEIKISGLWNSDPRFRGVIDNLYAISREIGHIGIDDLVLNKEQFERVIKDHIPIICQALQNDFVIPDFKEFCKYIEKFYYKCKSNSDGKPADYIPQLAKVNPEYWGVSLCTVDGQRFSIGDTRVPFTIQSTGKPINYAIALSELGSEVVHQYVGQEPSGRMFNELLLDHNKKPHNPMVNAGAIVICSLLLNLIETDMAVSEKFEWICDHYKKMAGDNNAIGFSNGTYLSEKEKADRNFAIAYYLKEYQCFPKRAILRDTMDFYFQLCSLEVTCETASVIASTLANGGICPITDQQVITTSSVRDVLSLMHSCGMYDYSGQFAFNVGLPTKSGVSGSLMVVIPNVMGMCCWSPNLDQFGNSVRGVQFCEELVSVFNFHQYDNLLHSPHKKDIRKRTKSTKLNEKTEVTNILFAACSGDVNQIKKYYLNGFNMNNFDYDGRTVLHIAASEGHLELVVFLVNVCQVDTTIKDRWNHTPLQNAQQFGHKAIVDFLTKTKTIKN